LTGGWSNDPGKCIEGSIVLSDLGGVEGAFIVKGYEHPAGSLIVAPYRIGNLRLEPGEPALELLAPWIIRRIDCMPRLVPVIDARAVRLCIDPSAALKTRMGDLPRSVVRLVEDIDYEWAGLTGSWAIYGEGPHSDVDIVLYGPNVYPSLVELHRKGLLSPCGPRGDRVAEPIASMYSIKLVESCVGDGVRVTLRILRSIEQRPCRRRIPLGRFSALIELEDVGESYLVPARYKARLLDTFIAGHSEALLETWRTRYQELPPQVYVFEGEAWIEDDTLILSPDIRGRLAPKAWLDTRR